MSGKFAVVVILAYVFSGCCFCNMRDLLKVDIVDAKITADGFCRALLRVTNSSRVNLYLLEKEGTYPELPISVVDVATGCAKKLTIVGTNRLLDYDSCQLLKVEQNSTALLNLKFDVVGYAPSEHLALCVRSVVDPCCNATTEIEKDSLACFFKSKGDREYPHMSDEEIESVKSALLLQQQISR